MELKAEILDVTPGIAGAWLACNLHNRPIKKRSIAAISRDLTNGNWHPNNDAITFDENGILLNGQHRLTAVVDTGRTMPDVLVMYNVPAASQDTMDQGAKRSLADVLYLDGEQNCRDLASTIRLCSFWDDGHRKQNKQQITIAEAKQYLHAHPELRNYVQHAAMIAYHTLLPRSVAALAQHILYPIDSVDADWFFHRFQSAENHQKTEPIFELREHLRRTRQNIHGRRPRVNTELEMALIIKAWNAYRNGEKIIQLRWRAGGAAPETFPTPI
jgi:hypothetical protein